MERKKKKRVSKYNPEAERRWIEKNPERKRYLSYRATCKMFIRSHATADDIEDIEMLIAQKKQLLKSNKIE